MANKTVYPFGTGGQLPSSIGVINDLTTGGADKALSAEMGKVLGEDVDALRFVISGDVPITKGKYIPTNQGVGNVCPMVLTDSSTNDCAIINLSAGQTLNIVGVGGNGSRLWAVLDKTTHVIQSVANANTNIPAVPFTKSIIAEDDCIVVVNVYNETAPNKPYYNNAGTPYSVKASSLIPQIVNDLTTGGVRKALSAEMGVELKSEVDTLGLAVHGGDVPMKKNKYIPTNQGVGEVCPMVLTDSPTSDCVVINLFAGQRIKVVGVGGNASRLWAVLDKATHEIQSVANINDNIPAIPFEKELTAEEDCIVVVNVYNENYPTHPYYNTAHIPYSVKVSPLLPTTDVEIYEPSGADTAPATATAYHALWDNLVTSGLVERSTIATAQNEPVYLYHIGVYNKIANNPSNSYNFEIADNDYFAKKKVLLISGIHGYERLTPMYAYEFFNRILTDDRFAGIRSAYEWYVVPLVNPTGFNNNTRNNYNNVDINRDFKVKSQLETQAICTLIDNNTFDMFIDMHQSGAGRSQYSPQVCGTLICPRHATAAELQEICTPYYIGGSKADATFNEYFGKSVAESCFAWPPITISSNQQQSHDYAYEQGIVKSVEFEFSQYCYAYSNSDVIYNHTSYVYGNTLLHYLMMQYFGSVGI